MMTPLPLSVPPSGNDRRFPAGTLTGISAGSGEGGEGDGNTLDRVRGGVSYGGGEYGRKIVAYRRALASTAGGYESGWNLADWDIVVRA